MHNRYSLSYFDPNSLENLARELIQAREKRQYKEPLYIQTYGIGYDGGIDFKVAGKNIYGQVRKCDTNFNSFFASITRELPKVQKRQPERYFIVTNYHLLPSHKAKIEKFFHPFIKSDGDILGRDDLINLLNDYQSIAERYFPSSHELTSVAKESFKEYNKVIKEKSLFFKHKEYYKGLEILSNKPVLIITGEPGIGKTTLARALSYHYKEVIGYDDFFYISDVKNAIHSHRVGRSQIFIMDDILADVLEKETENELLKFIEFLKDEKHAKLIITSRRYIYKSCLREFNSKLSLIKYKRTVEFLGDCMLDIAGYSRVAKEHILFNQIKHSNLSLDITRHLATADVFFRITDSPNFLPRIIEDFFNRSAGTQMPGPNFVDNLLRYFNNPYEYWMDIFNTQKESYKYILLIMLASNAPILYEDLIVTFRNLCKQVALCRMGYESMEMEMALLELDGLFIRVFTDNGPEIIEFKNPSIKDFLLQFLHENGGPYIEHLIQSAAFFNQILFAFSTKKGEEIYDELENEELWDGTPMFGKKVTLTKNQKELLLNKMFRDFNDLGYSQLRRRIAVGGDIYEKRKKDDILIWKLVCLVHEFDPAIYPKTKEFVCQQMERISFWRDKRIGYIGEQNMLYLPRLLKMLRSHYKVDPDKIVSSYFDNIQSIQELYGFQELEEIYPDQFALFLIINSEIIQEKVLSVFTSTVDLYTGDKSGKYQVDSSLFLDEDLNTVEEDYGVDYDHKIIRSLRFKIRQYLAETDASMRRTKSLKPKDSKGRHGSEETKPPKYKLLLPENKRNISLKEGLQYFQDISGDTIKQYSNYAKKNIKIFAPFFKSRRSIEFLVGSCEVFGAAGVFQSELTLYYKYFDYIYYEFYRRSEMSPNTENGNLIASILGFLFHNEQYFKRSTVEEFVNRSSESTLHLKDRTIDVLFDEGFILENSRDWYSCSFRAQMPFLLSMWISVMDQNIKKELYNNYLPKIFDWNVEAPSFWRFSRMLDKSFFIQHILLKQLVNFVKYSEKQLDSGSIASILNYLSVKIYFRQTEDAEPNSYDVWKIETPKRELLCVLDLLGAKLDFRLLSNWFKNAFRSQGDVKQTHNAIVNYIESFYEKFSYTLDPSPVDDKFTAFHIFPLENCLNNAAFLSVIKRILFPEKAIDLVEFCRNKIEELELELHRHN